MLLLRDARRADLEALVMLAAELNSVNLPNDARALSGIIEHSRASFQGKIRNPLERSYVFMLEDPRAGRVIGTSMLIAQHGTRESPCTFFDVSEREHYSSTLDRHFRHRVLSIGYHFDGPTEIGGLVVRRSDRGRDEQPGKQLAYVRFLFLGMHRERFRDKVLAELMPPLLPDGRSLFWESCGKRFTGLDYQAADKKSRQNKEFIQQLFPPGDLYVTLFPLRVQRVLGSVGPKTRKVKRLLERVGFRYVERIDPFDGGPHFEARVADVTLVRALRKLRVAARDLEPGEQPRMMLVGVERADGRARFRAVRAHVKVAGDDAILLAEVKAILGVRQGDRVHVVPFE